MEQPRVSESFMQHLTKIKEDQNAELLADIEKYKANRPNQPIDLSQYSGMQDKP